MNSLPRSIASLSGFTTGIPIFRSRRASFSLNPFLSRAFCASSITHGPPSSTDDLIGAISSSVPSTTEQLETHKNKTEHWDELTNLFNRSKTINYPQPSLAAYQGRSVSAESPTVAYRRLMSIVAQNNVRKELRLIERYEKPTVKRRREKIERHKKLFAELIKKKVRLIVQMKNRGM